MLNMYEEDPVLALTELCFSEFYNKRELVD